MSERIPWWCLSFADASLPAGSQWLGTCFVEAHNEVDAVRVAHIRSINPGGEVQMVGPIEADIDPNYAYRLMQSRDEVASMPAPRDWDSEPS